MFLKKLLVAHQNSVNGNETDNEATDIASFVISNLRTSFPKLLVQSVVNYQKLKILKIGINMKCRTLTFPSGDLWSSRFLNQLEIPMI